MHQQLSLRAPEDDSFLNSLAPAWAAVVKAGYHFHYSQLMLSQDRPDEAERARAVYYELLQSASEPPL